MNVLQAVRGFLVLVGPGARHDDGRELLAALDRLAVAAQSPCPAHVPASQDPPEQSYPSVRTEVSLTVPGLGLYRAPDLDPTGELLVGDAVDDLADIVVELRGVAWRLEHTSEKAALEAFHRSYHAHWGAHLRVLQWYLYELGESHELGLTDR